MSLNVPGKSRAHSGRAHSPSWRIRIHYPFSKARWSRSWTSKFRNFAVGKTSPLHFNTIIPMSPSSLETQDRKEHIVWTLQPVPNNPIVTSGQLQIHYTQAAFAEKRDITSIQHQRCLQHRPMTLSRVNIKVSKYDQLHCRRKLCKQK